MGRKVNLLDALHLDAMSENNSKQCFENAGFSREIQKTWEHMKIKNYRKQNFLKIRRLLKLGIGLKLTKMLSRSAPFIEQNVCSLVTGKRYSSCNFTST